MSCKAQQNRLDVVQRALRFWDPIGVIENAAENCSAAGEYDSYAWSILALVESGASGHDVARRLASIRTDSMGLGERQPADREEEVGEMLIRWRDEGFKDEPDFRFR